MAGASASLRRSADDEQLPLHLQQGQWALIWRQLRRNHAALLGLTVIAAEIVISLSAQWISPYDPLEQDVTAALKAPSAQHWLGTDDVGRDILSRILHCSQISLRVGLISVSIAGVVGVTHGIAARTAVDWPAAYGDRTRYPFGLDEWYSIELGVSTPIPEWEGRSVFVGIEEDGALSAQDIQYFAQPQDELILIPS